MDKTTKSDTYRTAAESIKKSKQTYENSVIANFESSIEAAIKVMVDKSLFEGECTIIMPNKPSYEFKFDHELVVKALNEKLDPYFHVHRFRSLPGQQASLLIEVCE